MKQTLSAVPLPLQLLICKGIWKLFTIAYYNLISGHFLSIRDAWFNEYLKSRYLGQ